jgi:hypothetical protein
MHQRHDLRLLPHVEPGDGPTDDHALNLARSLKIVKVVEVRAVSAGKQPAARALVSTSSARFT